MSKHRIPAKLRQYVIRRAHGRCEYCRCPVSFSPDSFSVEHIIPRARGGTDDPDNLALSCQGCNNLKSTSIEALDPAGDEIVSLFHPRQQHWDEHFTWSEDFSLVVGLTPTGRATVQKLRLNRRGVVNLRRALTMYGEHPPTDRD